MNRKIVVLKHRQPIMKKIPAHPLICWLSKLFRPLDPWVEIPIPPTTNSPVYLYNNIIFASPEQSRILNMENIS